MKLLEKIKVISINIDRIIWAIVFSVCTMGLLSIAASDLYDYRKIIASIIIYIVLAFFTFRISDVWYIVCSEGIMIANAFVSYMVLELVNFDIITWDAWRILVNALPFYIIGKVLYLCTMNIKISTMVTMIFTYVYSLGNYFVYTFRGQPILPWDIRAIKTAATVAGTYEFSITKWMVYAFIICALVIQFSFCFKRNEIKKRNWKYIASEVAVILCALYVFIVPVYPKLWGNMWDTQYAYTEQGVIGGFFGHLQYCFVEEPDGYSNIEMEATIRESEKVEDSGVVAENIIVIMNESFSDFRIINDEIISDEYMPFIDSLTENTIKGNLYVPVFGGSTCDSEFEVLLSASTAYTTPTPYQTAIVSETESLVSYLKERGYFASAFHPYEARNWNRESVYAKLGFEEFLTIDVYGKLDLNSPEIIRWCVSDQADYEQVIQAYENHNDDKFFMFNVTMQNHGGYETQYDNFPKTVDLSAYGSFIQAETYLSMIKESDKAFQYLVEYFTNVEEPTVICMFGDHFPKIEDEFYSLLYGKSTSELTAEERQLMYATPMIIWTNYDIEEGYIEKISANYLSLEVLKAANIELEGYYSLLNDVYEIYPVISKNGIIDAEGNWYNTTDLDLDEVILKQKKLQYYRVYDN